MEAHLLSINNFNMPKVFKDTDAMYVNIIYLIMLEKGKFQTHPDMGVDVRGRYRDNNKDTFLQDLQVDINDQINRFLPELSMLEVYVSQSDHILGILINTENGIYTLAYNADTDKIEAPATYILDDLQM